MTATSEAAARVQDLLERMATGIGVDAKVEVSEDDDGDQRASSWATTWGCSIGHHGQTIDAIQHLAYRIAYKGAGERKRSWSMRPATGSVVRWRCVRRRPGRGGGDPRPAPRAAGAR